MNMFRKLSEAEAAEFRMAARVDYRPLTPISPVWHPVYRAECDKMNEEYVAGTYTPDSAIAEMQADLAAERAAEAKRT